MDVKYILGNDEYEQSCPVENFYYAYLPPNTDIIKTVLQNMLWSMVVNEYINESSELSSFVISEIISKLFDR